MITVPVDLGERSYDVLVGAGARHRLLEVLPTGVRRAAIVTQEAIGVASTPASSSARSSSTTARRPSAWRRSRSCAGSSAGGA